MSEDLLTERMKINKIRIKLGLEPDESPVYEETNNEILKN